MNERLTIPDGGRLRRFVQAAADVVFPGRCLACSVPLETAVSRFCDSCLRLIEAERRKLSCPRCAGNVALYEVRDGRCGECRGRRPHVAGLARVGPYGGLLAHLLRKYKFGNREQVGRVLGAWLGESVARASWRDRVEAVTFVPSHWSHRFFRPPHPAEELARFVARRLELPCVPLLRRVRSGPHQVGLTFQQRLVNVRGMFAVRSDVQILDATLMLIDDVRTSGATLNECGKRLRRAGAKEVFAAVVVRAQPSASARQHLDSI